MEDVGFILHPHPPRESQPCCQDSDQVQEQSGLQTQSLDENNNMRSVLTLETFLEATDLYRLWGRPKWEVMIQLEKMMGHRSFNTAVMQ